MIISITLEDVLRLCIVLLNKFHSFVGFRQLTQILIDKGAHVNARNSDGETALIVATKTGKANNLDKFKPLKIIFAHHLLKYSPSSCG